ncbi:hypothetical protein LCI18_007367 [Fusarium solani-melongenae]|uniref:Uncharacterized protein n=1 Tax=Fusarium solani subsp. cucurbitae TaxID=2747967 RepID=A0ACD3Z5J9_FUSSC|nr:hypothetical protein LCI18_007367 [Fusarium solani-melongenae]
MTQTYEYDVPMFCGGCASAVRNAVTALPNVQSVDTSVEKQKVTVAVEDDVTLDQVKLAIQKAGKQVKGGRVKEGEIGAVPRKLPIVST